MATGGAVWRSHGMRVQISAIAATTTIAPTHIRHERCITDSGPPLVILAARCEGLATPVNSVAPAGRRSSRLRLFGDGCQVRRLYFPGSQIDPRTGPLSFR